MFGIVLVVLVFNILAVELASEPSLFANTLTGFNTDKFGHVKPIVPKISSGFDNMFADKFKNFDDFFSNRNSIFSSKIDSKFDSAFKNTINFPDKLTRATNFGTFDPFKSSSNTFGSNIFNDFDKRFEAIKPGAGVFPQMAFASASFKPGVGGFQTAAVFPENGKSPNVIHTFTQSNGSKDPNTQFYGVFTSSSSSMTDNNGRRNFVNKAQSAINDNGKVTGYAVSNLD